jgi:hypothetical protein
VDEADEGQPVLQTEGLRDAAQFDALHESVNALSAKLRLSSKLLVWIAMPVSSSPPLPSLPRSPGSLVSSSLSLI